MEILATILATLSPIAVVYATGVMKTIRAIELAPNRVALVRFIAAVLAIVGAVLTDWAGGAAFDPSLVEGAIQAFVSFGVATYVYHLAKK